MVEMNLVQVRTHEFFTSFGMARDGVSGDLQVAPPMWDCIVHARQYPYSPEKA
jgi:hypothetical protein